MKTKITLVNGKFYIVDKSPKEVMEATTNQFNSIFNGYYKVEENVWVVSGHILKIEAVSNIDIPDDDDTIVMS